MRKNLDARFLLLVGIVFFIAAKAFFVLSQTSAMGMPRLGDDAFTHLWRATQVERIGVWNFIRGESAETRAGADILTLCDSDSAALPQTRARCARVADNTAVPDVKPAGSLLLHAVMRLGLPLKWSYAVFETLVAGAVGASFAFFLARLFGPAPAGIALILLSFLNLIPPQGLHQFVPSTLAIGLSLALWGVVLRGDSIVRYIAAAIGFALLSRVHPVALVYAGGLVFFAVYAFRHKITVTSALAVGIAAVAALAGFLMVSGTVRGVIAEGLSTDLIAHVEENLQALPSVLGTFAIENWAVVAAILASLVLCRRVCDGWVATVAVTLLALSVVSLAYRTQFFLFNIPLDLFARVFVGVTVLACGVLAAVALDVVRDRPIWWKGAVAAGLVLVVIPSLVGWRDALYGNVNSRMDVIDDRALADVVAGFEPTTTLGYGELEIAPTAVFVAGGDRLGAIPLNGLSARRIEEATARLRPAAVVVPNFPPLNSLAFAKSHSLERRRYGFASDVIEKLAVTVPQGSFGTVHLLVENPGDPVRLGPNTVIGDDKREHPFANVDVPAGTRGWITVDLDPAAPARTIIFNLPASGLWIEGISLGDAPRAGVNWPWDSGALVQWSVRGSPRDRITGVVFSATALLRGWQTPGLSAVPLATRNVVLSDRSGLVFLRTDYAAPTAQPN